MSSCAAYLLAMAASGNANAPTDGRNFMARSATPPTAVITCGDMSKEERIEAVLAAAFGAVLWVATPQLPQPAKIVLWLLYLTIVWFFLVLKIRRTPRLRMSFPAVLIIGLFLISVASVAAWYVFPPEQAPAAAARQPGTLPLTYKTKQFSWDRYTPGALIDIFKIQSEFLNTSEKNMILTVRLIIRLRRTDGFTFLYPDANMFASWMQTDAEPARTLVSAINVPAQSSVSGFLRFKVMAFESFPALGFTDLAAPGWSLVTSTDMVLEIKDQVSGVTVLSSVNSYPSEPPFQPSQVNPDAMTTEAHKKKSGNVPAKETNKQ